MSEPLLDQIRQAKPVAPTPLHERVALIAAQKPVREPFLDRFQPRRVLLVAPVAVVAVLLAAGVLANLPSSGAGDEDAAPLSAPAATTVDSSSGSRGAPEASKERSLIQPTQTLGAPTGTDALAPSPGRLQRFQAEMRLRVADVEELSAATKSAMRIAQSLRGYVVSVQYDAPAQGVGGAQIVLRVPTARVQTALTQLSALGMILGQRIGIEDLQQPADDLAAQIEDTQRELAQLRRRLESTTLADEERAVLQARLADARRRLTDLRTALTGTRAEASLATISLGLTTERIEPAAVEDGRLDDLKEILAWEGAALLYVLVIAGPFVLLGILIWLGLRFRRRQSETRLLEQN
ncbi:MAG: DUF4349 domain-containing protein [Actinobacteria bacterium]|nr:DUF4349 domain-containing protein [Actinomycetota bacterium]